MDLIGSLFLKEFRVSRFIGEGSFGKVFIAKSMKTSEDVALKIVLLLRF